MKYIIVEANATDELEVLVNEKIDQGYTPIGGVESDINFYQSMVLEDIKHE